MLVTGATGFIGRHAVPLLARAGFEVHGTSRHPDPSIASVVAWHAADLADHAAVSRLVESLRPTHLVHLAWTTRPGYYSAPENVDYLRDSLHLVRAFATSGGRRLVAAGTSAEYDLGVEGDLREDGPLEPNGIYGVCKKALHDVIRAYAQEAGLSAAWGRIFFCYGPWEDERRLVPTVLRALGEGRVPFHAGRGVRDYLHVEDVAGAFVALADSSVDGAVNIGSGVPITVRELLERLATAAGEGGEIAFGELEAPAYEPARVVADVSRLRSLVGPWPRRGLDDGLRETVAWWRRRWSAEVSGDRRGADRG